MCSAGSSVWVAFREQPKRCFLKAKINQFQMFYDLSTLDSDRRNETLTQLERAYPNSGNHMTN